MKKPIVEIAEYVPNNLKFGVIVAIALFWAEFLRTLLRDIFVDMFAANSDTMVNFILAIMATIIGVTVFHSYRRLLRRMKKIKV